MIAFDRIAIELCDPVPRSVPAGSVTIETDSGELIDKIAILEIVCEDFGDAFLPHRLHLNAVGQTVSLFGSGLVKGIAVEER